LVGAIFDIFCCLEVFGSWLGPGSNYFGGWKGWKLENGDFRVEIGRANYVNRGASLVPVPLFRPGWGRLGGVYQSHGDFLQLTANRIKLKSHSLVAPRRGLADMHIYIYIYDTHIYIYIVYLVTPCPPSQQAELAPTKPPCSHNWPSQFPP
jgi:hypothetical protein